MRIHSISQAVLVFVVPMLSACSLGLTDVPDPSTIVSPDVVQTQAGAVGLYNEALTRFSRIHSGSYTGGISGNSFVLATGLGSDEFAHSRIAAYSLRRIGTGGLLTPNQQANGAPEQPYSDMHNARMVIDQSIGALKTYGVTTPSSLVAQLYALRGYLSVMFAELFCSGVPFSRAVYGGDVEFGRPKTTTEMLEQAVADFDSALSISTDSVRIRRMAMIGKARALVNLKEFARAAALMRLDSIPTNYRYDLRYTAAVFPNFAVGGKSGQGVELSVADRMGTNGLNYLQAGTTGPNRDVRVAWYMSTGAGSVPYPAKYVDGSAPIPLADGIEARLIEAEARLNADDYEGWATILNGLRQSGGAAPMPVLSADSTTLASKTLREDVMFRERAFWLYATGHRFGDLRRLVRQYGRASQDVFPFGMHPYLPTPDNVFGDYPNFGIPQAEAETNPYFTACFHRDA